MDRHERLSRILDLVGQQEKVDVDELVSALGVSPATVRRDLDQLAEQQLLARTRGGAVSGNVAYDLPLRHKAARHAPEKQRISEAAARLVEPGMVIGLNGGTTTTETARALVTRPSIAESAAGSIGLTVVTNALNIANELTVRPQIKTVVTGGVARPNSFELTGPFAALVLGEIRLDMVFLGVDAVDPARGAFAHHEGEASTNRALADKAARVVVTADSSKLSGHAFAQICSVGAIDTVVTDSSAERTAVRSLELEGVRVIAA